MIWEGMRMMYEIYLEKNFPNDKIKNKNGGLL